MKALVSLCLFLLSWATWAQDFNAQIQVDASRIDMSNKQVFVALQNDLNTWFNATSFSGQRKVEDEKVRVRFYLNILSYQDDFFTATLQMQLSRPIFWHHLRVSFAFGDGSRSLLCLRAFFPIGMVQKQFTKQPRSHFWLLRIPGFRR